jgi:hypothetical protein
MRWLALSISVALALALAACSAYDERQWLKVDQKYTTEEFRRDHAACLKSGKLDDACMRSRGWVAVNPTTTKAEQVRDPNTSPLGAPAKGGRY